MTLFHYFTEMIKFRKYTWLMFRLNEFHIQLYLRDLLSSEMIYIYIFIFIGVKVYASHDRRHSKYLSFQLTNFPYYKRLMDACRYYFMCGCFFLLNNLMETRLSKNEILYLPTHHMMMTMMMSAKKIHSNSFKISNFAQFSFQMVSIIYLEHELGPPLSYGEKGLPNGR